MHGASADPEACRRLADLVGDDLYELAGEVEKLATWARGQEIRDADVDLLVAPRAESPPWNLTDAWGSRDVGGVLRAAERMLDRTGDPVSRTRPSTRESPVATPKMTADIPSLRGGASPGPALGSIDANAGVVSSGTRRNVTLVP